PRGPDDSRACVPRRAAAGGQASPPLFAPASTAGRERRPDARRLHLWPVARRSGDSRSPGRAPARRGPRPRTAPARRLATAQHARDRRRPQGLRHEELASPTGASRSVLQRPMHRDIFAFQAPLRQHNRYAPSCHSLNGASLATRKQCAMTNLTRASLAENPSAPASATPRDRHWDFLLVCVAAYLTTAVGRIHQLFLFLSPLKLVFVSATLAIVLYFLQQVGARRIRWVRSRSTTYLL